jgi:hypothetical protein
MIVKVDAICVLLRFHKAFRDRHTCVDGTSRESLECHWRKRLAAFILQAYDFIIKPVIAGALPHLQLERVQETRIIKRKVLASSISGRKVCTRMLT